MKKKGSLRYLKVTKRDKQTDPVYHTCGRCKGEIYLGQTYYEMEAGILCVDCLHDYARNYFLANLRTAMPEVEHET